MAKNVYDEYSNESSIDRQCEPLCTPCDHIFCRECITRWLRRENLSCPICRTLVKFENQMMEANRDITIMFWRFRVICVTCDHTRIKRRDFDEHTKACPKAVVLYSAGDVKCPWKRPRNQLSGHVETCVFHPFRTVLTELMHKIQQLEEQIK